VEREWGTYELEEKKIKKNMKNKMFHKKINKFRVFKIKICNL